MEALGCELFICLNLGWRSVESSDKTCLCWRRAVLKKGFSAVREAAKGNEALSENLMAFLMNLELKGFFVILLHLKEVSSVDKAIELPLCLSVCYVEGRAHFSDQSCLAHAYC